MDFNKRYLFSIGNSDECIMQWEVNLCKPNWELDYLNFEQSDVYEEQRLMLIDHFSQEIERLSDRSMIPAMKSMLVGNPISDYYLRFRKVLGRRAFNNKLPLLITVDNQLITTAGSLVLTTKLPSVDEHFTKTTKLEQSIIDPDINTMFSQSPEISTITLCSRKQNIALGVKQMNSAVLIWDIMTQSYIQKIKLSQAYMVDTLRYSESADRIVALCRQKSDFSQALYLLDIKFGEILAYCSFPYSHLNKIMALDFYFSSNFRFLTCGIQHASLWEYTGGMLESTELPLQRVKDLMRNVKAGEHLQMIDEDRGDDDLNREMISIRSTFLCVLFIDQFFVLGAEDGEVESSDLALHLARETSCPNQHCTPHDSYPLSGPMH